MRDSTYTFKVFETKEELQSFIKNTENINIIRVEANGDKRVVFYEEKRKTYVYDDYNYEDVIPNDKTDFQGWNELMWRRHQGEFNGEW